MLDLKAKLLAAGLVTADQVKKVEEEQRDGPKKAKAEEEAQRWRKRLDVVKEAGKAEQYETVRGWVERHRIDSKTGVPSEGASRHHFARPDGTIGHITLEPDVQAKVAAGEAGIIAFMGHNGVEHAVVPADLARDIGYVKAEWLVKMEADVPT